MSLKLLLQVYEDRKLKLQLFKKLQNLTLLLTIFDILRGTMFDMYLANRERCVVLECTVLIGNVVHIFQKCVKRTYQIYSKVWNIERMMFAGV